VGGYSDVRDEPLFREILETVADGVYFVDRDRRILSWNRGAERITGFSRDEVVLTSCFENKLRHVDGEGTELCTGQCPLVGSMQDGAARNGQVFLHHKLGHRVPVEISVIPLRGAEGFIVGAVEVFRDVSSSNGASVIEDLRRMAFLDPLTELGNRRYAEISLDSRLHERARYGWPLGVLFNDVDHFTEINDRHGHATGDEVLRMVARTLRHAARASDFLGRWGGEEFLALLPNATEGDLAATAERFRVLVESSALRFPSGLVGVTASVGATLARPEDTRETVVRRADALMYEAKGGGRNRVVVRV
jgi:diguanylate cyclase (GGDEF)-like protein/PAS domain S-box-containing protein